MVHSVRSWPLADLSSPPANSQLLGVKRTLLKSRIVRWPKGDIPPWRENEDLHRIEHRRVPPGGDMQRRGGSGQLLASFKPVVSSSRARPIVRLPRTQSSQDRLGRDV